MHFVILANKKQIILQFSFGHYFLSFRITELPIKMYFITLRNKKTLTNENVT